LGNRVFVNTESGAIEILSFVRGDCNDDGNVDTTDLAVLKLFLAGVNNTIGEGADIDKNGKLDTGDLATLKLFLAGVIQFD
jgi:endoglucanase